MIEARRLFQTWCLYGPAGGGKSTLAATAPKPVFLDSNQGLLSIAERPGFEHVARREVQAMKDLDIAYDNCTGAGKTNWAKRYGTIVFDHWDDIQNIVLDELADRALERDSRRDPDQLEQREWGIMGNRLRRYLRKFKRVPMHRILICGEKEDRETGRMKPSLSGSLASQLPYLVDHTIYLRIGSNGRRYLHFESGETFYAKTRAWWLPAEQRKTRVAFDDTRFLTNLFDLIAAGPKGTRQRRKETSS